MSAFQSFAGSCAVCLQGTDTAIAFVGSLEWKAAGLHALGIPLDEACGMVERFAPYEDWPLILRVCAGCVRKNRPDFPDPRLLIQGAELPAMHEPSRR